MFGTDTLTALVIPGYEPYRIPKNWCWTRIDSICRIFTGDSINERVKAEKYTGRSNGYVYIATKDIGFDSTIDYETNVRIPKEEKFKIAPKNTTILCIEGGSAGRKIGFVTQDVCFVNKLCAFVPNKRIFPKYLYYTIQSEAFKNQFDEKKHGLIGGVSLKEISSIYIPLIPFNEQIAVVAKIESLFSKLDKAKEKAQEILDSFNMRKASILNNAFSGKLTEKWRKEHKIGLDSWKNSSLISLSEKIFDGPFGSNLKSEDYVDAGIRVVRLENLKNLWFDDSKQSFITKQKYDTIKKHTVFPSDLIMSTFIADEIKVCQMPSYVKFAVNKADCIGIRLKDNVNKKYVLYYLSSKIVFNLLIKQIHGATRPRVNSKQIKSINIFIPTIEEQNEIVESLDKFINNENKSKESAEMVIDQIDLMKKSILSKAFRGELGTNNPNDENAEELLKRILSEKAKEANEQPKVKRTRIVIPEEIENLLQTNLEREIIKLFYKSETKEVPEEDVMSVSSRAFDNLDAVQSLEEKKLIKKSKDGIYKLLR